MRDIGVTLEQWCIGVGLAVSLIFGLAYLLERDAKTKRRRRRPSILSAVVIIVLGLAAIGFAFWEDLLQIRFKGIWTDVGLY